MSINQKLSVVIPRVFPQWIDENLIADVFEKQHIGKVYKVSIVRMPDEAGRNYPIYKAYIYFSWWYENEITYNLQRKIYGPKRQARVVYDDPWYWVLFENTQSRLSSLDRRLMRLDGQTQRQLSHMASHMPSHSMAQHMAPHMPSHSMAQHMAPHMPPHSMAEKKDAYTWPDTWSNLFESNDTWAGQEASRSTDLPPPKNHIQGEACYYMCDDCHAEEQIAWEQQASIREPKQREPKQREHTQREHNKIFYNRHIKGQPCEYTCEECYNEEQAEWAKQAEASGQPYIFYGGVPRQEPWMSGPC